MRPQSVCQGTLCLVLLMATAASVRAQTGTNAAHPVEVSAFVSQGSPASSRIGAAIAFAWTSDLSVEMEMGYRRSDIDAVGSSVNLLYALPRIGRVAPYLAGGAGLEKYASAIAGPNKSIVTLSNYAFTVNAGGGVKVPVDDNWAFRSDARWYKGFGRHGQEHWRLYNGVTLGTGQR